MGKEGRWGEKQKIQKMGEIKKIKKKENMKLGS